DGGSMVSWGTRNTSDTPSPVLVTVDSRYLRGIAKLGSRLIILLDLDQVLSPGEKKSLEALEAGQLVADAS
ncbi:MAG: hypothetical protein NUW23_14005, partial [Firmicutes bacterium]|nr:hypothetical protein [Bacillota bacterium]